MKNIHLLPTTQDSWLCLKDGELVNANDGGCMLGYDPPRWITQHIYITNSEEIKDRDWFFNPFINEIQISCNPDGCKKIILTTDTDLIADGVQAIDDEFLEWFVKNPSCEEVEVKEMKCTGQCWKFIESDYEDTCTSGCELKGDYKIIIPKEEPKQETLEEAAEKYENKDQHQRSKLDFIEGVKWQQERSYSEEEVRKIAEEIRWQAIGDPLEFTKHFDEWFEENKKK